MNDSKEYISQAVAEEAVQVRVQQSRSMVRGMVGLGLFAGIYAGTQNPYGYTVEMLEPTVVAGSVLAAASERTLMYRSLNRTVKGYANSNGVFGPAETGTQRPQVIDNETGVDISKIALEVDPNLPDTSRISDVSRTVLATGFTYAAIGTGVSIVTGEAAHYEQPAATLYGYTFFYGSIAIKSFNKTQNNADTAELNALARIENINTIISMRHTQQPSE